jgi:hypothetical protein
VSANTSNSQAQAYFLRDPPAERYDSIRAVQADAASVVSSGEKCTAWSLLELCLPAGFFDLTGVSRPKALTPPVPTTGYKVKRAAQREKEALALLTPAAKAQLEADQAAISRQAKALRRDVKEARKRKAPVLEEVRLEADAKEIEDRRVWSDLVYF